MSGVGGSTSIGAYRETYPKSSLTSGETRRLAYLAGSYTVDDEDDEDDAL